MARYKKYPSGRRSRPYKKKFTGKNPRTLKIRPGANSELKQIFTSIGVPDKKPFKPDPFQVKAVTAVTSADCLVTAPTGAGKTWIAEQAISQVYEKNGKSWYASPLKALSNAKYTEFSHIFGAENVGILTGDRKENPGAPIIIGTTEILRNQLYDAMHHGETLSTDFVVLDEAHFLGDEDRGVVWEEIMIYLPSRIPLLLLSATIGNAYKISGWLSSIRRRECRVIEETTRPVPLQPLFFHPSGTLLPLISKNRKAKLHKKITEYKNMHRPPRLASPGRLPPFGDMIRVLKKYDLLPVIFFLKSRSDCDAALDLCLKKKPISPELQEKLSRRIEILSSASSHISKHRQLCLLEHLAIGAHHSGQLPAWKLLLETLMSEGLLEAIFATSTVAAGVNFPARTIAFLNSDRYNGVEFLPLTSTEFHQMTGRAGRRGMDNIGFAMAVPGKYMNIGLIAKLFTSTPSDVISQIRINFSMVLNLLLSHTPEQVEDLLEKSFATYLHLKSQPGKPFLYDKKFLWNDFKRHLEFLTEENYAALNGELTDDGHWASKLRLDHPLLIAEGLRKGMISDQNPSFLAAIIAMFVDEREPKDHLVSKLLPKDLMAAYYEVKKELKPFQKHMSAHGFEIKQLFIRPVVAVYNWANGMPWEKVTVIAEMEEGTFARLVYRTADSLRHIKALSHVFPQTAESAKTAIELIMRDPVDT